MSKKIIILILIINTILFTSITFAENNGLQYDLTSYSENDQNGADTPFFNVSFLNTKTYTINYQNFSLGFQFFFDLMIGISIATAVIVFMIAAFQKIIGNKNWKSVKGGEEGMTNAIVGLMIILSTWLIINTINPDLLRLPMFQGLDGLNANHQTSSNQTNISGEGF